jgi:ABC-2 type transport system ATP-binding protein
MMPEMMIQTENLTKRFPCSTAAADRRCVPVDSNRPGQGGLTWFTAVDRVSLDVEAGEIVALLGPNGAGKTTTVRLLASILSPSDGWARVAGFDTVREPRQVRQAVGLLTEFPGLYLRMRTDDYLGFFGELQGMSPGEIRRRTGVLLERFGLTSARHQRIAEYSKGMRQKLALIRAMIHDPALLLLDEPTSAMDPHSAKIVRDAILSLGDSHTVVVCTHNLTEAELLAHRIAIIHRGQIVAFDTPARLKDKLLGSSLLEVRLAHSMDGLLAELDQVVQIEASGPDWFRFRTDTPERTNPELLRSLAGLGAKVMTLSEVPRSLEDVYLRIVETEEDNDI